LILSN